MNSAVEPGVISALAGDCGAFMQQLDLVQRRALFLRITQAELRAASFLDERLGMQGRDGYWIPLEAVADVAAAIAAPNRASHFIFHIGHCGSTLLSRLLDLDDTVLGLREPLVLRELAAAERELDAPTARLDRARWQRLFDDSLAILGRRFADHQQIVIKATSTCNDLIEPLLEREPFARIVLLHLPLEPYLATMLKAPGGGLDALHAAPVRLASLHRMLGDDSLRLHALDAAETVAMGWIAELARFLRIAAAHAKTNRVVLLDFENLLADPGACLDAVRRHFGLPGGATDTGALLASPVMRAYAKSPAHAYSPADRSHDLELSRKKFSAEIGRGMRIAEKLIAGYPQLGALGRLLR